MKRLAATAACIAALAACSGAPTKPDAPAGASVPGAPPAQPPAPGRRKVSPYAPAQEDPSTRGDYVAGGLYKPGVKDSAPTYIPDVDAIPEPDVVDEPLARYGNRSPYKVLDKSYVVRDSPAGYVEQGIASYYGNKFHGRRTSSQEVYDMYAFTAAHRSLPLPSFARVTNLDNGKSVVVRVNDRGPFHEGRLIDLSYAAAVKIGAHPRGTARVEVRGLTPGENARQPAGVLAAAPALPAAPAVDPATGLPPGVRVATGKPQAMPPSPIDTLVKALPIATAAAGERAPDPPVAAAPAPTQPVPAATAPAASEDWRFDMRQDGKAMTADEFDAWMRARRARVATGKAGRPDPYGSAAPGAAAKPLAAPAAESVAAARTPPPAPASVASAAADGDGVLLQVAAFGARDNAERALAMLRSAGIGDARLFDGTAAGKPVWRLRVGPVKATGVADVTARVAGLGFGAPHVVRE